MAGQHQLSIMFPREGTFDAEYFLKTHVPLVVSKLKPLGLKAYTVVKFSEDAPFGGVFVTEWETHDAIKAAVASPEIAAIKEDVKKFASAEPIIGGGEIVARG